MKSRLRHLAAHSARTHARHSTPSYAAERLAARRPTANAAFRAVVRAAAPTIRAELAQEAFVVCPNRRTTTTAHVDEMVIAAAGPR